MTNHTYHKFYTQHATKHTTCYSSRKCIKIYFLKNEKKIYMAKNINDSKLIQETTHRICDDS